MVDGINPFSSSFAATNQNFGSGFASEFSDSVKESGPFWRALSDSQTTHDAGKGFMMWGSREILGRQLDKAMSAGSLLNKPNVTSSYFQKMFGFQTVKPDKLGTMIPVQRATDMAVSDLKNVKGYVAKVQNNFEGVGSTFKQSVKNFSPKQYFKESIWEANKKPIVEMFDDGGKQKIGSGLARIVGLGFVGWEVASAGKKAYNESKADGDSKMQTMLETTGASAKQLAKSAMSWEAAGVGLTLGRFLLPSVAGVPLGGIALGVGFSVASRKLFDKADETISQSLDDLRSNNDTDQNTQSESSGLLGNSDLFGVSATA